MAKLLTYEQAKALGEIETKVKNHIKDNYPTLYYTKDKNILGRYGNYIVGYYIHIHRICFSYLPIFRCSLRLNLNC